MLTTVKLRTQLSHVDGIAALPVNTLHLHAEEVDGLDALVHDEGHGAVVAAEELVQRHAKYPVVRR